MIHVFYIDVTTGECFATTSDTLMLGPNDIAEHFDLVDEADRKDITVRGSSGLEAYIHRQVFPDSS